MQPIRTAAAVIWSFACAEHSCSHHARFHQLHQSRLLKACALRSPILRLRLRVLPRACSTACIAPDSSHSRACTRSCSHIARADDSSSSSRNVTRAPSSTTRLSSCSSHMFPLQLELHTAMYGIHGGRGARILEFGLDGSTCALQLGLPFPCASSRAWRSTRSFRRAPHGCCIAGTTGPSCPANRCAPSHLGIVVPRPLGLDLG